MAILELLAEELMDKIVVDLREDGDTHALLDLSLVSKKFRRIVEPHLYRKVKIPAEKASKTRRDEFCPLSLQGFIRTLQVRKHVTRYIKEVTVRRCGIEGYGLETLTDMLVDTLTEMLPNLQTLLLPHYTWSYNYQASLFSKIKMWNPALRFVDLSIPRDMNVLALHPVFELPAIHAIGLRRSVYLEEPESSGLLQQYWGMLESVVKHVHFDKCMPSEREIELIHAACPLVQSFDNCTEAISQLQLGGRMHWGLQKLRRYSLTVFDPYFPFEVSLEGPNDVAQKYTPFKVDDHPTWYGFQLTTGERGTRELQHILAALPGWSINLADWEVTDTFYLSLSMCNIKLEGHFDKGVILTFRLREMTEDLCRAVMDIKRVAQNHGMECKASVPTPP